MEKIAKVLCDKGSKYKSCLLRAMWQQGGNWGF